MPCNDIYAIENSHSEITVLVGDQNDSSDFDLCSPFCFCNCCQSFTEPISSNLFDLITVSHKSLMSYQKQNYPNPIISIWHPPKI